MGEIWDWSADGHNKTVDVVCQDVALERAMSNRILGESSSRSNHSTQMTNAASQRPKSQFGKTLLETGRSG